MLEERIRICEACDDLIRLVPQLGVEHDVPAPRQRLPFNSLPKFAASRRIHFEGHRIAISLTALSQPAGYAVRSIEKRHALREPGLPAEKRFGIRVAGKRRLDELPDVVRG